MTLPVELVELENWRLWLLILLRERWLELRIELAFDRPVVTHCAHGRLRPGRLCPRCRAVGTRWPTSSFVVVSVRLLSPAWVVLR